MTNQMTRDSLVANDGQWGSNFVKNPAGAQPQQIQLHAGFPGNYVTLNPKDSFSDQSGRRSCLLAEFNGV